MGKDEKEEEEEVAAGSELRLQLGIPGRDLLERCGRCPRPPSPPPPPSSSEENPIHWLPSGRTLPSVAEVRWCFPQRPPPF